MLPLQLPVTIMAQDMKTREEMQLRLSELQPIDGVAAIRASDATTPRKIEEPVLPDEVSDVFGAAGWQFIKAGSEPEGQRAVYRDADGQVKIDGGALNVRLQPDVERAEIDGLLDRHGLVVRRELGFAPNLFLVSSAGASMDSVSLAQVLTSESVVLYAEPVLIEKIGTP